MTALTKGNRQRCPDKAGLETWPRVKLIAMLLEQREDTHIQREEIDRRITELSDQLAKLVSLNQI